MAQKPHSQEGTLILSGSVRHYTCNPPPISILGKHGILPIGDYFGCMDRREVLIIPHALYGANGYAIAPATIAIVSEQLLRQLDAQK